MDYYIDLEVMPNKEFRENVLLNKVYTKCHHRLVDMKSIDIGVSFPDFKLRLGSKMRVHGLENRLHEFLDEFDLGEIKSSVQISKVLSVPMTKEHRIVSRQQPTMSPSKLRRLIKRNPLSEEQVKGYKKTMFQKGLNGPYLELESQTSAQRYRRYIVHYPVQQAKMEGIFDSFGLSKQATIPWF